MRRFFKVLLALALIGLIACLTAIGLYLHANRQAQREFAALRLEADAPEEPAVAIPTNTPNQARACPEAPVAQKPTQAGEALGTEAGEKQSFPAMEPEAIAALAQRNPDLAGWVSIADTLVDLPVMHTPQDPERYLYRNFEKRDSKSGTPFLAAACSLEPRSRNLVVYGHNMRDGTMFAAIGAYRDEAFVTAHPAVRFDTRAGGGVYEVFALIAIDASDADALDLIRWTDPVPEMSAGDFLNRLAARSLIKTQVQPGEDDEFLTLVTCEYTHADGRLAVFARRPVEGKDTA